MAAALEGEEGHSLVAISGKSGRFRGAHLVSELVKGETGARMTPILPWKWILLSWGR